VLIKDNGSETVICHSAYHIQLVSEALMIELFAIALSTAYVSQTRVQKRFTISEVAPDWHKQMLS